MAKPPIALSASDEATGALTVTFTRENFSEFIFNLLVTPREERRNYFLGYDLFKDRLRKLTEKIEQHIHTHHELLNATSSILVLLDNGTELTYTTLDQFFDIDDPRGGTIISVSVEFTHVLAFFREKKKSYERQHTTLKFTSGKIGSVECAIRSTDISWPNGIFALIERELDDLCLQTAGPTSKVLRAPVSTFLARNAAESFARRLAPVVLKPFVGFTHFADTAFLLFVSLMGAFLLYMVKKGGGITNVEHEGAFVFSEANQSLMPVSVGELVSQYGVDQAVSALHAGSVLRRAGLPINEVTFSEIANSYFSNVPGTVYIIGLVITVFFAIIVWNARALSFAMVGRIFVFHSKVQPREMPSILSTLIPSMAVGLIASLIATLIWEALK